MTRDIDERTTRTPLQRRNLLRLTGVALAGVAGCTGDGGGGGGGDGTSSPTAQPTTTATDTPTPTATPVPAASLSVVDAETDDRSVTVPGVVVDGRGWLVIHPEASGGGPNGGVTLAQRRLDAGSYSDVTLELDTLVAGEQTVYAMLHYDDPADGEFTFPANGDPPVTVDGAPVIEPFTVTGTGDFAPGLAVTDQKSDGETLVVPRATIDRPGWLVVHPEASGGGPNGGVTVAQRQLRPGTYGNVALDLTASLSSDQTLYAMLHYEDPADGQFTFPANGDPAVTADGSPVIEPFRVTVEGGGGGGGGGGGTATVEMRDTSFDPLRLSVSPGTTVEWVNRDPYPHDVKSAQFHDSAAAWDYESDDFGQGGTATYTFEEAGVYEYYCTIHGRSTMCGAVLVGDASLDVPLPCEDGGGGGGDDDDDGGGGGGSGY